MFRIRRRGATGVIQLALADTPVPDAAAPADPTVEVATGGCTMAISPKTGLITFHPGGDAPALALRLRWLEEGDGRLVGCELTGSLQADEALVGFGERFSALDQRGRALYSVVYEQYKNHGNRTYIPMPFFLSNQGYGCLVEGTGYVAYDLGRTVPDRWRCLAMCGHAATGCRRFPGRPAAQGGA
ncbi:MAG: hypothetical protein IPK16_17485 [Anaerolineales bacterium]|nr:hypothetical protein [Anaerolineales bacterium]